MDCNAERGAAGRRVVHIVGDSQTGGVTKVIEELVKGANERGWATSVVTTDDRFQERLESLGAEIVRIHIPGRSMSLFANARAFVRLARHLKAESYDVVHTHRPKIGLIGRSAARWARGDAVVHTTHGFVFGPHTPRWIMFATVLAERLVSRWTTYSVAVTQYHAEQLVRLRMSTRAQTIAIPNGITPNRKVRSAGYDWDELFTFLVVGRLANEKGLETLAEAMKGLPGDCPWRLQVVGDGPMKRELMDQVATAGLQERIEFLGFRSDVDELLLRADCYVMPSLREGLSISLLEAMAAGTPIVATNIPGNAEATGQGAAALLARPGDVVELRTALRTMLQFDPHQREELGQKAKERFETCYSAARMRAEYVDVYERAVGASRRY